LSSALIFDHHAKIDGFGGFGSVMQEGGSESVIGHVALQGAGTQQGDQA
jgi:hypothetical protein